MKRRPKVHLIAALLSVAVFWLYTAFKDVTSDVQTRSPRYRMLEILGHCQNYAKSHGDTYPDGRSSNEAFRKLFQAGLIKDEGKFRVNRYSKRPDDNIGDAKNGFGNALETGECEVFYVRPHHSDNNSPKGPSIFAFRQTDWQNYWVWASESPMTTASERPANGTFGFLRAEEVNLLSPDYWKQFGVDFKDVLAPEGFAPDVTALNNQARANRSVRWLIFIPYGLFLIADLGYVWYARRKLRKSSAATS